MAQSGAVAMRPLSLSSANPARENVDSTRSNETPAQPTPRCNPAERPYLHGSIQGALTRLASFANAFLGSNSHWRQEGWKTIIATFVGIGGFAIACVALWSTITATNDGRKAEILAEWTAKKDFLEFCQAVSNKVTLNSSVTPYPSKVKYLMDCFSFLFLLGGL